MAAPEVPIVRLLLYLNRMLLEYAVRRELERLEAAPTGGGLLIYEGLFNIARVDAVFTRESEDVAEFGFHVAPIRSGIVADTPIDTAEMDAVKARLLTFWDAVDGWYPDTLQFDRIVFHDAGPKITDERGRLRGIEYTDAGKRVPGQGVANPALRTDQLTGLAGTSDTEQILPPQVAMDVTLKTQFRRQWGRFYLPAGDTGLVTNDATHAGGVGQIAPTHVVTLRNAAGALLDGLSSDDVPMVVWSTKHQHALSVDQVQVDSLFDVIRSRRYDRPRDRLTHTLGA